ncbi:Protein NRT1/ PTR FAMILY 4.3, partial [Dichanthelium oligosanthes]
SGGDNLYGACPKLHEFGYLPSSSNAYGGLAFFNHNHQLSRCHGYALLALQAHLPSLLPPRCNPEPGLSSCKEVHGWRAGILYISLYTMAFGEGCVRSCLPSVGADQFDSNDPSEARQQSSFFNWFTFCLSVGSFAGLILIVWLESSKGFDVGFGVSALLTLLGLLVATAGLPFYRNRVPQGSALTRVLQVLIVAFKNRRLELPENMQEAQEHINGTDSHELSSLVQTKSLKFLDKACIKTGRDGGWSVCSMAKVEETKIVLRMLPIFVGSMVGYVSSPLLVAFTVQQGATTNTRLGMIHVSPAMLFIVPTTFQMLMLVAYDRFLVPFLRRRTGYVSGITHLQRVGVGFLAMVVAPVIAAVVESKRRESTHRISLFWLAPQFFLLGVADTTSFVGLLEFFNSEAPPGMKSIGVALFWCQVGLASWLGTLLVQLVNWATRRDGIGWLEGAGLNNSRLDLFYWVVAVVSLLGLLNYLYWARRYKYRHNPRIVAVAPSEDDSQP